MIAAQRFEIAPPPPAIDVGGEDLTSGSTTWTALPDLGETTLSAASSRRELDHMHARFRSPLTSRFLSTDPVGGSPRSPQSWNRYAYVMGNPMKYVDPTGELAQVLDAKSLDLIRRMFRPNLAKLIQLGKNGFINKALINSAKTNNPLFLALKEQVNHPSTIQVKTSDRVQFRTKSGGISSEKFFFDASTTPTSLFLGYTATPINGPNRFDSGTGNSLGPNVEVTVADLADAPERELAITMAHEFLGHALLYSRGLPFEAMQPGVEDFISRMEQEVP